MQIKITVIKIETKKYTKSRYEKIADTGNEKDNGAVYDYVQSEDEEEVETTLFEQTVEDMPDLMEVIKAFNQKKN